MSDDPKVETDVKIAEEREDFERLLLKLDPDRSRAVEKYGEKREMLAKYFECNHCSDPNELANETLSRVAMKLRTEEIKSIDNYAYGVARLVRLEDLRRTAREVQFEEDSGDSYPLEHDRVPEADSGGPIDDEIRLACLRECLAELKEGDSKIVVDFYRTERGRKKIDFRKELAKATGQAEGTLRVRMHRLRARLRECVEKRMNERRKRIMAAWNRQHPGQLREDQ
jgi:DNA-directed RNA polymerase specialized sigma24 family protein